MNMNAGNEKSKIQNKLVTLREDLISIEENFKIDLKDLIKKVSQSIYNIEKDLFSIAFFGAFSDGKSTILSVLIDKLDIEISPEPKTDKVQSYKYNDYQIVDTPGLYSENFIHDELTKKYISEANIIIYTVDPTNPLKNSHIPTIKWILSDLKKMDATIFVVNKMDEIADLEDDNDFYRNSTIKKEVVSSIIKEEIGIEKTKNIVCIAADPYEQGLEFWKEKDLEYKRLSRISDLEMTIAEFKEKYKNELIIKAGISVIKESCSSIRQEMIIIKDNILDEIERLTSQISEYESSISVIKKDINRSYQNIKEELISLREDILVEFDSVSNNEDLRKVIQKRLGDEGYILEEKIQLLIQKHTGHLIDETEKLFKSMEESMVFHSNIQSKLLSNLSSSGKSILKGLLSGPNRKIADAVLKTRNALKIPFKFKPYGALKFAKLLKSIPVVIEGVELIVGIYSKFTMDKKREKIKTDIESAFKKIITELSVENYTDTYFSNLNKAIDIEQDLEESKKEMIDVIESIKNVNNKLIFDYNF